MVKMKLLLITLLLTTSTANIAKTSCYYNTRGFVYAEYSDTCRVLWDKHMVRLEDMR